MRRVTITTLICALIFGLLATWLGPKMIAYWYTPPVPAGAFNCTDAVQWAMNKLVVPFAGGIRLRAAAASPADAKQACATLKAAGENCFVAQ